jgi:hypothetical protein
MTLPPTDASYLTDRAIAHQVVPDGGMVCVVLPGFRLSPGYDREAADLLIRLQPGYPDLPPDMWWFDPAIHLAGGGVVQATEVVEHHLGRPWQRWSRHLQPDQWKSGVDGLESYLALIGRELNRCAMAAVS